LINTVEMVDLNLKAHVAPTSVQATQQCILVLLNMQRAVYTADHMTAQYDGIVEDLYLWSCLISLNLQGVG
jgi:hypothetical protein